MVANDASDASRRPATRGRIEDSGTDQASSQFPGGTYYGTASYQSQYQGNYPAQHSAYQYPAHGYAPGNVPYTDAGQSSASQYVNAADPIPHLQSYHSATQSAQSVPIRQGPAVSQSMPRKRGVEDMNPSQIAAQLGLSTLPSYASSSAIMSAAPDSTESHRPDAPAATRSSKMAQSRKSNPSTTARQEELTSDPPPTKKGRTNISWSAREEIKLRELRDEGSSWAEIARQFPGRTEGSVKKHWYKDMRFMAIPEGDEAEFSRALRHAMRNDDRDRWKRIGEVLGKPAKVCENFARQHLKSEEFPGGVKR